MPNTTLMHQRHVALTMRTAVALAALVLGVAAADAQKPNEERIWARSDTAVLDYMRRSAPVIAQGYSLGHKTFYDWYVNRALPSLDDEPAIAKVFAFAFDQALRLGGPRLLPGSLGELTVDLFRASQRNLAASTNDRLTPEQYLAKLEAQLEKDRTAILTLPDRFERDKPDLFEEAMTVYLHEELDTPGIHAASDFRMGEETRAELAKLGFPEPNSTSAYDIAERLLTSMILATNKSLFPKADTFLDAEQRVVEARIAARRALYPKDRERYCQDAWKLGMLKPNECS